MDRPGHISPIRVDRNDPISHAWINQVAAAVVQRIHVVGGRAKKFGNSIIIEIDPNVAGGGGSSTPGQFFPARITGADTLTTNARWAYHWEELEVTGVGFGTLAGGRVGSLGAGHRARNIVEDANVAAAGVGGDGVDTSGADYPAGFTRQRIVDDVVVFMFEATDLAMNLRYFFSQVNSHDGTCAE